MDENKSAGAEQSGNRQQDFKLQNGIVAIGELINDRPEILAHIGTGGMGEVYKVLDRPTGTVYAMKMIICSLAQRIMHDRDTSKKNSLSKVFLSPDCHLDQQLS